MTAVRLLEGPLGMGLAPLGVLYGAIARLRVHAYRRGWLASHRPPMPTLSIGNLSVGGTGKTPLLFAVLDWLEAQEIRPGVLSRGYGGDEGRMLEARHPTTLLAEDPDRRRGLRQFLVHGPPEVLILDDGFQHLRLQRDLDVVLLDATRPFGRCLPAGRLREPIGALRRADRVVLSRADLVGAEERAAIWRRVGSIRQGLPELPRIEGGVRASRIRNLATGEELPSEALRGRRALLAAGIGNPGSFRRLCEDLGVEVAGTQWERDHCAWPERAKQGWESQPCVLVTEKDGVKLRDAVPDSVWEVQVDWVFHRGEEDWRQALDALVLPLRAARIEPLWAAVDGAAAREGGGR